MYLFNDKKTIAALMAGIGLLMALPVSATTIAHVLSAEATASVGGGRPDKSGPKLSNTLASASISLSEPYIGFHDAHADAEATGHVAGAYYVSAYGAIYSDGVGRFIRQWNVTNTNDIA